MSFDRFISVTPAQLERLQAAKPEEQEAVLKDVFEQRRAQRLEAFQHDIVAPSAKEYGEHLHATSVDMPLRYLTPYQGQLSRWSEALADALAAGKGDAAIFAVSMMQAALMELTLTFMEDGAPLHRLWLGDQGDMRSGESPDLEVVRLKGEVTEGDEPEGLDELSGIMMRIAKQRAAVKAMGEGEPFDVEDLFGGEVPSFEELPDCGQSPCPACDGRRAYFAERKVH